MPAQQPAEGQGWSAQLGAPPSEPLVPPEPEDDPALPLDEDVADPLEDVEDAEVAPEAPWDDVPPLEVPVVEVPPVEALEVPVDEVEVVPAAPVEVPEVSALEPLADADADADEDAAAPLELLHPAVAASTANSDIDSNRRCIGDSAKRRPGGRPQRGRDSNFTRSMPCSRAFGIAIRREPDA